MIILSASALFAQERIAQFDNLLLKVTENGDLASLVKQQQSIYDNLDSTKIKTGFLADRSILFSNLHNYDGRSKTKLSSKNGLRQISFELGKMRLNNKPLKHFDEIERLYDPQKKVIPISIINFRYNEIKENAERDGLLINSNNKLIENNSKTESPYETKNVFAAAPIIEHTYLGRSVRFKIAQSAYLTNLREKFRVEINFGDGSGFRQLDFDREINISYTSVGIKIISVRMIASNSAELISSSKFEVFSVNSVAPAATNIEVTATIPYSGVTAAGTAYLFKSPKTTEILNPIIIAEGFDISNSLFGDELYAFLNQEGLAECLLNNGYDLFILNYTDSKTYIQANAMLLAQLIKKINTDYKVGDNGNIVMGASMGGLVARYALRYMENNEGALGQHETRLFISFDGPQKGANVPMGDQFWIDFFASQSPDAAEKIGQLNSIAAQQLLVYHHLSFPYPNQYRSVFTNELSSLGYPQKCRKIAISNGAGNGIGQPYNPGAPLVEWYFRHWKVDVDGNSWAVPNVVNHAQRHRFPRTMTCKPIDFFRTKFQDAGQPKTIQYIR